MKTIWKTYTANIIPVTDSFETGISYEENIQVNPKVEILKRRRQDLFGRHWLHEVKQSDQNSYEEVRKV